jgi:hypothetical protein
MMYLDGVLYSTKRPKQDGQVLIQTHIITLSQPNKSNYFKIPFFPESDNPQIQPKILLSIILDIQPTSKPPQRKVNSSEKDRVGG